MILASVTWQMMNQNAPIPSSDLPSMYPFQTLNGLIWGFPEIGVLPNHRFIDVFPLETIHLGVASSMETPC